MIAGSVLESTAEHEEVVLHRCAGVDVAVAIHSTRLGPALGGLRVHPYRSALDGVIDVLRLSRAMTAKAALAGLDLGGGKAVAIGDPGAVKSPAMLAAFGELVDALNGRYVVAEDVGTTVEDIERIAERTSHVAGRAGRSGDPSPWTARGVVRAIEATAEVALDAALVDLEVCVIGVGKVGAALAALLAERGARIAVSDVSSEAIAAVRAAVPAAQVAPIESALGWPCDIVAPCALGGILHDGSVPALRARAVVGAANNQLLTDAVADTLHARDICYVPDFVANAGGLINIAHERLGYDPVAAGHQVDAIGDTVRTMLRLAAERGEPALRTATAMVAERLAAVPAS